MPLYMDYHDIPGIKLEEAEKAHLKDLAVQEKYQVKYLAYWVNEQSGKAFCLMEAPDKEAIRKTHLLANGVKTCNIVEVEGGLYSAFMGENLKHRNDLVLNQNGTNDNGYRFVLCLDMISITELKNGIDPELLKLPEKPIEIAQRLILKNQGTIINQLSFDQMIATFKTPESCLQAAKEIHGAFFINKQLHSADEWNFEFSIGLTIGEPVTATCHRIFQKAIDQSIHFSKIAPDATIAVSEEFGELSVFCNKEMKAGEIVIIDKADQLMIGQFFDHVQMNLSKFDFTIEELSTEMGMSRSHLYRKMNSITQTSPIQFLRDVKLRRALTMIKEKEKSITEIAYDLGFSNPSYFSKCFKEKYGISPSRIVFQE